MSLVQDLGLIPYPEALTLQRNLAGQRARGEIPDTLLLCEHPPVLTVGSKVRDLSAIANPQDLPVVAVERGGDVTYHGPGQLVGYPILQLAPHERDLHAYLRHMEGALIALLADWGLLGDRKPGLTGVWVGDRKVASIGVAVRRWVTLHGFALNLSCELTPFRPIHPCGLQGEVMTSVAELLGALASDQTETLALQARERLPRHLGHLLGRHFVDSQAQLPSLR